MGLPGIAALFLGGLYAIGALLKMSDLRGADLPISDTLPFVPLPELLSRGIGTALTLTVAFMALAAFSAAVVGYWEYEEDSQAQWLCFMAICLITASGGIVAVTLLPWILGIAVIVAIVLEFVVEGYLRRNSAWPSVAVVALGLVITALAQPHPLPKVELQTRRGDIRGNVITIADGDWYVGQSRAIQVVSRDEVITARITPRPPIGTRKALLRIVPAVFWPVIGLFGFFGLLTAYMGVDGINNARQKRAAETANTETASTEVPARTEPGD